MLDRTAFSVPGATDQTTFTAARLPREVLKELSQRSRWRSFAIIAFEWMLVAAAIGLSEWSGSWIVYGVAVIFIATRQHAILIMMHDACHYLLSPNRTMNDVLCNLFSAFPHFMSLKRYRASHLAHHRLVNGETDPDLEDNDHPKTKAELYKVLLIDLMFMSIPKQIRRAKKFGAIGIFAEKGPGWGTERLLLLGFVAVLVTTLTLTGNWGNYVLYWLVPFFSVLQAILHYRGYSEHAGRFEETDPLKISRTIDVGFIERVLFAPCWVNRHLEHHLYPSIPCYNLEKAHEMIAETSEYRAKVVATNGYISQSADKPSVFGELYGERAPVLTERPAAS